MMLGLGLTLGSETYIRKCYKPGAGVRKTCLFTTQGENNDATEMRYGSFSVFGARYMQGTKTD